MSDTTIKRHFADYCEFDETLKYSGLYTDLCGMSVEDFIKTNSHCNCGGGGNSGENEDVTTKKNNTLIFSVNQNNFLTANLTYTPTQQINVSCKSEGIDLQFTFTNSGVIVSEFKPTTNVITITDIVFNPTEDDKYKYGDYIIKDINEGIMILTPNKVVKYNEIGTIDGDDLTGNNIISDNKVTKLTYTAPLNDEVKIINMGEIPDGYESTIEWYEKNSWLPIFTIQKDMLDKIRITDEIGNDITEDFETIRTITIGGKEWCILAQLYYGEVEESEYPDYLPFNGKQVIILPPDASDAEEKLEITLNFELK